MSLHATYSLCRPGVALAGLLVAGALLTAGAARAQAPAAQRPKPAPNFHSPEPQADGHVVFRLYAPAATAVIVQAEGPEATPGATEQSVAQAMKGVSMTKDADGVWTGTAGPFQPGAYGYSFVVDGVAMTDPRNPDVESTLNGVQSLYEIPGAAFMEYQAGVPHGAIAKVWYFSPVTKQLRRMQVYTPPSYTGREKLPVLYLFHGAGGNDDDWPTKGRAGAILDNLIAEHKAVPMIVVMPSGHVSRNFQMSGGPASLLNDAFDEDVVKGIVPYIDQHYATLADREHRAIAGLSMGGLQAITTALANPGVFDTLGVFSSGWFPEMRKGIAQKELADYKAQGRPFKLVWVNAGKLDVALVNSHATVELMRSYGIQPQVHESEGFHAFNNWRDYLHEFAPLLFQSAK
jgi:enterochelin esterase-like enzyme